MKILPLFRLAVPLVALFIVAPIIRAQRLYDNNQWPNPSVAKMEDMRPALTPPAPSTGYAFPPSLPT
jgi:hypothetical protein